MGARRSPGDGPAARLPARRSRSPPCSRHRATAGGEHHFLLGARRAPRRCPTNPSAPVTSTLILERSSSPAAKPLEIGVDHHRDQLSKAYLRSPTQLPFCLARIGLQQINFGRTHISGIPGHVLAPVEPH